MRPTIPLLTLTAVLAVTAVAQTTSAPPRPRMSLIAEIGGDSACDEAAMSPRARLLACSSEKGDLRVYDVQRHTATILIRHVYAGDVAWSPAGDKLAFYWWKEDGGDEYHIWTQAVDPRTGSPIGAPRRVSVSPGSDPSFSPDGKFIAFASLRPNESARKLIVIPSEGGSERVLLEGEISGPYTWTPDGKWIYYAQRSSPTVEKHDVYRVAVADGRSERVATGITYFNGSSPDGRHLIAVQPTTDGFVATIMDGSGLSLGTATLPTDLHDGTGSGNGWLSQPLHFFLNRSLNPTALRTVDMATGKTREIASAAERPWAPSWSPDGRRVLVRLWNGNRNDLAVMNADGSGRRFLHIGAEPSFPPVSANVWSPDGRYVAYWRFDPGPRVQGFRPEALYIVEVETGKETKLVRAIAGHADFRWSADSKSIRYVHRDTSSAATKGQAHFSIRQVQLTGASRQLRDIGVRNPPGWLFVDDQWILMANDGALQAADRDQTIKLYDPSRDRPGISPDGKWIARAPNGVGTSTVSAMYEIVSTNGQTRSTVKLSGALHSTTPVFSADSRFLIVPNANAGYDDKTPTEPAQIVAVPVNGDAPRTIATLPKGERVGPNMLTLSPDGRTLLYVGQREGTQSYFDIDFSSVIGSAKPGTKR